MPRDIEYEENNRGFNWQYTEEGDGGIKCKNYKLCNNILSPEHYECHGNYLCMTCGDWFKIGGKKWNELEFRDIGEECSICNEVNTHVKFPANCGHWFCVECSKKILFWEEDRYHLSAVPYGCGVCPNGCENPVMGKQCYCEEYDEIQETWRREHPDDFKRWSDAENVSIDNGDDGSVCGSRRCPLCRVVFS